MYRRRASGRRGGHEARSTMDGHERECGRANLVGERRQAQRHSFTRKTPGPGGLMAKVSQVAAIEVDPVIRPPASVCPVALRVQGYRTSHQFDHTRRSPTRPASATRRKPSRGLPHPWAQAHPHQTYTPRPTQGRALHQAWSWGIGLCRPMPDFPAPSSRLPGLMASGTVPQPKPTTPISRLGLTEDSLLRRHI